MQRAKGVIVESITNLKHDNHLKKQQLIFDQSGKHNNTNKKSGHFSKICCPCFSPIAFIILKT